MSAISIFKEVSSPAAATGTLSADAAQDASSSSSPFVKLLSGMMDENTELDVPAELAEELPEMAADFDSELVGVLTPDILASLPEDVAAALSAIAQVLEPQPNKPLELDADALSETVELDVEAKQLLDNEQLLTPVAALPLRQGFDSSATAAADTVAMAASGLASRSTGAALTNESSLSQNADDIADVLAKPVTNAADQQNVSKQLNSTAEALLAAKEGLQLSPALSAMKEAMQQAGMTDDQADRLMGLTMQGAASTSAPSTSAALTTASPAPANSQWTVPGHALLNNPAWSAAMADRLTWLGQNGMTSASLHITPDDLGPIHVRIQMGEEGAKVAFSADHQDTQGLIERMLPKLNAAFEAQGLRLDDVKIQAGASQAAQLDFANQQDGQQAQAGQGFDGAEGDGHANGSGLVSGVSSDGSSDQAVNNKLSDNSQLDAYA